MHKVFKRILSFLLATVLLLSIDTTTIAAEPTSQSNKITQLLIFWKVKKE